MDARHQDPATQGRQNQQQIKFLALAVVFREILVGQHGHGGGRGDDQPQVEQSIPVDQQERGYLPRNQRSSREDRKERSGEARERQPGR